MKRFAPFLLFAALVVAGSCTKPVTSDPASGSARLEIRMVDSPAAFEEVNVVVESVQVHLADSDTSGRWITVNTTPATHDLLTLVNGAYSVIVDAEVPAGRYSQIRLYVGEGSTVKVDGAIKSLKTPSGSQSGAKLNVNATIEPDITYVLTIDFDAGRSVVVTGNPQNPQYILKPVIRVITSASTGTITGVVSPDTVQCAVWAFGSQDTVSTSTGTTGAFTLVSLTPDTYSVRLVPTNPAFKDTTLSNVSVSAGGTTNLGTVTLNLQ